MRTLNRPMFRMGGPIKEGVMHGIREPYRGGGKAALVGNPLYPSTMGREHHRFNISMLNPMNWKNIFTGAQVAKNPTVGSKAWGGIKSLFGKTAPVTKTVPRQGPPYNIPGGNVYQRGYPGGKVIGKNIGPGSAEVTEQVFQPNRFGSYLMGSPEAKALKYVWDGKGWVAKAAAVPFKSPLLGGALIYQGGKWLWPDGKEATDAEVESQFNFKGGTKPGRGDSGMTYTDPDAAKKLAAKKRDDRITNLLETMGYDAAKKDAVSKALIDASQIVSERGTLDKKNITRELINPIIQATSKRLEKPEQLNEAVRLMMTKAEIEKEMNPLDSEVKRMQIAAAKKTLAGGTLQEAVLDQTLKQGAPTGATLSQIARAKGVDNKVLPIKIPKNQDTLEVATEVITDTWKNAATEPDKVVKPGFYVVKDRIILVGQDGSIKPYL